MVKCNGQYMLVNMNAYSFSSHLEILNVIRTDIAIAMNENNMCVEYLS